MGRKAAGNYSRDDLKVLDPRHIAPSHENMRKAIQARGYTLEQFAVLMDVGSSTLGLWLDGDDGNAERYRLPNEALVRAARILGVSVWYLLDLTDSHDGSGAKPFEAREMLREWWSKAKDPEKAAPDYEEVHRDADSGLVDIRAGVRTWRIAGKQGRKCLVPASYDEWNLHEMWDKAAGCPSFDPETGDFAPESEAALDGYAAWLRWFRENAAASLKRDLLGLRGDYRDPLAVVEAELEYASNEADCGKFDALLTRIDAEAREAMNKLA